MGPSWGKYGTQINNYGDWFHSVACSNPDPTYALAAGNYNMLGQPASHGCVRLCVRDAKWIYDNIGKGTVVTIREDLPDDPELRASLELPPLARDVRPAAEALAAELRRLLRLQPGQGVLVAGLGNEAVTPDALGPLCLRGLFLTRHLIRHLPEQFGGVRPVSAVAPGVLATTGMESLELVRGAVRHVRPACVLAVDALAAAAPERLCRTFQLSDAGIVPGSGVGNARAALQKRTLGVPVFCLGVPTVLDAGTLGGPRGMIVTPRDIDAQVRFLGRVAADAVNLALHPEISYDDFAQFIPNR